MDPETLSGGDKELGLAQSECNLSVFVPWAINITMIVLLMVNTHAAVYIRVEAIRDQKSMAFNVQLSAGVRFISQANPGTSHNLCYWVPCVANVNLYMLVYIILKYSRLQQVKKKQN